ncbi:MAG TPA: aldehyde dehydrogenase family protein, partial [Allosphingosinicella sp.]
MRDYLDFYIGGEWVKPVERRTLDVVNPADESVAGRISLGGAEDVDRAVAAAKAAFPAYSETSREQRLELLQSIAAEYQKRYSEIAEAITEEMGAPSALAQRAQAAVGIGHLQAAIGVLKDYPFEELRGSTLIKKEPIGVCGFITPWNWPINQIATKVFPALATGCTMVLKPSEVAPFSGYLFAQVLHSAGVPAGVFNLVNGDGPGVGAAIAAHPDVDMVSFTGSTRAGIAVAKAAADTVKRVHQELGGKSPFIVLEDADVGKAVTAAMRHMLTNSGQSCNAPTRLLVPKA